MDKVFTIYEYRNKGYTVAKKEVNPFECGAIVYDESTITEEQKNKAIGIEKPHVAESKTGKMAILKANKQKNRVYYEYVEKPKQPELEELKNLVADLTELVLGGEQ